MVRGRLIGGRTLRAASVPGGADGRRRDGAEGQANIAPGGRALRGVPGERHHHLADRLGPPRPDLPKTDLPIRHERHADAQQQLVGRQRRFVGMPARNRAPRPSARRRRFRRRAARHRRAAVAACRRRARHWPRCRRSCRGSGSAPPRSSPPPRRRPAGTRPPAASGASRRRSSARRAPARSTPRECRAARRGARCRAPDRAARPARR